MSKQSIFHIGNTRGGGRPAPKFLIKYAFGEILKNTVLREMFLASSFFSFWCFPINFIGKFLNVPSLAQFQEDVLQVIETMSPHASF